LNIAVGDFDNFIGLRDVFYDAESIEPSTVHERLQFTLDDALLPNTAKMMYGFSTFMVTIVTSNLLIAVMTNTYTAISENATNEFLLEKASTLAEIESMMSDSELANKEWFPNYLHVLVPTIVFEGHVSIDHWMGAELNVNNELAKLRTGQDELKEAMRVQQNAVVGLYEAVNGLQVSISDVGRMMTDVHNHTKQTQRP